MPTAPLIGIRPGLWQKGMRRHTEFITKRPLSWQRRHLSHDHACNSKMVEPPPNIREEYFSTSQLEEVYMVQPPRFESGTHLIGVCQLKNPLYGLQQAPRTWHLKKTQYIHQMGFKMSKSDNSLFFENDTRGKLFLIIYVDDLVIGGVHIEDIKHTKKLLSSRFEMTNMKELHYFLGIEVIRTPNGIVISQ